MLIKSIYYKFDSYALNLYHKTMIIHYYPPQRW